MVGGYVAFDWILNPTSNGWYSMTELEAFAKLTESFENEPRIITPKGLIYEDYVEECKSDLLKCVIEPVKVTVRAACFPEYDFTVYRSEVVWAIVKRQDSWLITIEGKNQFALAFGETAVQLMMHGFSSSDALAEWLS